MKIKTAEQYASRFERRGRRTKLKERETDSDWALIPHHARRVRKACQGKPNHILRAVSMEDVFHSSKPAKAEKPFRANVAGIPLVGQIGRCPRMLVKYEPHIEPEAFARGTKGRLQYHPFVYPCVGDHGMKRAKNSTTRFALVPVTGKKGEHRDSLGRTW